MRTTTARKRAAEPVSVKGFFRLKIIDDSTGRPRVVGDSGWKSNTITNLGFNDYLCQLLGNMGSSLQAKFAAIGTGTAPAAAGTALLGEITDVAGCRCALTPSTIAGSKGVLFAFTLASGVATTTYSIQNVGLFAISNVTSGQIFAGNTFATSQLQSNQALNGSYTVNFS